MRDHRQSGDDVEHFGPALGEGGLPRHPPASDLYSLGCLIHEERYALAAIIPNAADTYAAK
ncbi:hypothetical protein [Nocardia donostiensis]|uniref:Uncharacterized protein n=1 Tax=Nocardia donostiensis TaxID=1538463 RepID=A0A1V2TEZ8_9NOCA|nr:hypothetical protein [Nocardia donostiensis]ONM48054.1 hypothetical protein B0T46_13580 [Nocardia donostiensis]OQS20285.1 hypothetical protein B0T44_10240 [Nocardia donostiensis]